MYDNILDALGYPPAFQFRKMSFSSLLYAISVGTCLEQNELSKKVLVIYAQTSDLHL